ncbi:hypothetical protein ASC77_01650 [Nocardioides sp. Root1257]|uniref:DUF4440 domain-containing protein n=1 Tax=unclassified Nocardioides TaxID=2615069 RepID=UPI0006F44FCF|nr:MULTISPECIES: DUF4440 domain-containing protein [unclassified Nocardioides]KQW53033.1 hypothetical protein ASC77_01650 [Nocardioides sp. Root1257]KRC55721.1 hypothetical protein ASE24_01650 [Nocardioides sp. Root224]
MTADRDEIDAVVATFFDAFTSGTESEVDARLEALRGVLLPETVIVSAAAGPAAYDVDAFIEPRRALLTGGRLADFREWEVESTTEVWGGIAQRWCSYAKEWVESGVQATGRGRKSIQLVRTDGGWRISAVAWDDQTEDGQTEDET